MRLEGSGATVDGGVHNPRSSRLAFTTSLTCRSPSDPIPSDVYMVESLLSHASYSKTCRSVRLELCHDDLPLPVCRLRGSRRFRCACSARGLTRDVDPAKALSEWSLGHSRMSSQLPTHNVVAMCTIYPVPRVLLRVGFITLRLPLPWDESASVPQHISWSQGIQPNSVGLGHRYPLCVISSSIRGIRADMVTKMVSTFLPFITGTWP